MATTIIGLEKYDTRVNQADVDACFRTNAANLRCVAKNVFCPGRPNPASAER
jgi:hypothetical protein